MYLCIVIKKNRIKHNIDPAVAANTFSAFFICASNVRLLPHHTLFAYFLIVKLSLMLPFRVLAGRRFRRFNHSIRFRCQGIVLLLCHRRNKFADQILPKTPISAYLDKFHRTNHHSFHHSQSQATTKRRCYQKQPIQAASRTAERRIGSISLAVAIRAKYFK